MRGLSGGQKVKVVLGACTWNQPHILVMDEPTNYLDRDSLGALAGAIKDFGGGVVIISHHNEFTSALCPETWTVKDGLCDITGAPAVNYKEKLEFKVQEEVQDAFGNTIKVKGPKKELSRKDKKKKEKERAARKARGEEVTDSEEDM
jgi:elongation factor 3